LLDLYELSDYRIHRLCKEKAMLDKFILAQPEFECSGKIVQLKKTLDELFQAGHRVLIFSQMTR
jgi:SNF2 family DNA or RNA helicase